MCKSWLLLKNILLRKKRPKYANWHFFWHNLSQSTKSGQPGNRDIKDEWQEISMFPRMDAICKNAHHISLVENRLKSQDNCTKPQLFAIRRQATSVIPQNMAKQDVMPHLSYQRNAVKSIRGQCARPVPAMFAATKSCLFINETESISSSEASRANLKDLKDSGTGISLKLLGAAGKRKMNKRECRRILNEWPKNWQVIVAVGQCTSLTLMDPLRSLHNGEYRSVGA